MTTELDPWARGSDGSTNIYPGESGMVAAVNSMGYWAAWLPDAGVRYDANYYGRDISVTNQGNGTYSLTVDGVASVRQYAPRWVGGVFFDAQGGPVASFEAARYAGDPLGLYYEAGAIATTADPAPAPGTPTQPEQWTRSSDGAINIWAGDSGMVASLNSRGFWGAWVPPQGVTYQSHYGGDTIAVRNEGGSTYSYQDGSGRTTLRRYAARWVGSTFWDATGNPVVNHEAASAPGDPAAMYYAPGEVYTGTAAPPNPPQPNTSTPTVVTNPPTAGPVAPVPTTPTTTTPRPPTSVNPPGTVYVPPVNPSPVVVPFPTDTYTPPPVSPDSGAAGAGSLVKIVAIGAALYAATKGF